MKDSMGNQEDPQGEHTLKLSIHAVSRERRAEGRREESRVLSSSSRFAEYPLSASLSVSTESDSRCHAHQ